MRTLYRIGILFVALVLLAACSKDTVTGNGKIVTKTRIVAAFNKISISGIYRLDITGGTQQSVRITSDSNIIPQVITRVKNGLLTIQNKSGIAFKVSKPVLVRIMVQTLKSIKASGANQIRATKITADQFKLATSGDVQAILSGTTNTVAILISGSANINANRLIAKAVKIRLIGSGRILVNATQKLDTKITGNGTIIYSGNPSDVDQTITGKGKIERQK